MKRFVIKKKKKGKKSIWSSRKKGKKEILAVIQADGGNTARAAMTKLGCITLSVINNTNPIYKYNGAFIMLLLEVP